MHKRKREPLDTIEFMYSNVVSYRQIKQPKLLYQEEEEEEEEEEKEIKKEPEYQILCDQINYFNTFIQKGKLEKKLWTDRQKSYTKQCSLCQKYRSNVDELSTELGRMNAQYFKFIQRHKELLEIKKKLVIENQKLKIINKKLEESKQLIPNYCPSHLQVCKDLSCTTTHVEGS